MLNLALSNNQSFRAFKYF